MKKKLSILVALLLCFAMLAGCASNAEAPADDQTDDTATSDTTSDDGAASGDPIKIGMVAPVTGTSAMVGEYMENGFKLAADEINAEGGILGHPIELVLADEVDNAQSSVTGMQLLISEGDFCHHRLLLLRLCHRGSARCARCPDPHAGLRLFLRRFQGEEPVCLAGPSLGYCPGRSYGILRHR